MKIRVILLFAVLLVFVTRQAQAFKDQPFKIVDCRHATLSRPQSGHSFRGIIVNEDYAFTAKVPNGYTGWDGVDQNAPFHGFTIFLDQKMDACIHFEIHLRVDEADAPVQPRSAKLLTLGGGRAWQSVGKSPVGKITRVNIKTSFSFKQANQVSDGEVLLVTPLSKLSEVQPVYDAFVRSLMFRN